MKIGRFGKENDRRNEICVTCLRGKVCWFVMKLWS
jgi:hypothetical protein